MPTRKSSRHALAVLGLALLLFSALAVYQLDLPGLHNDEAQEAGLQAMQLLNGLPVSAFRGVGIGPRPLPLMVQDYIGAWHVYLALPFMAALGPGAVPLRLSTVVVGWLTLGAAFAVNREWFDDDRAAAWGVLLLAIHPSFVFWYRQGVFITSVTTLFSLATLWVFGCWARHGDWRWLGLLGVLVGFGLYAKLLFVWVVGGLLLGLLLLNLPRLLRGRWTDLWPRSPDWRGLLAGVAGTALGVLPLVAYNLQSSGTFLSVMGNLGTSYYGIDNSAIIDNLATRWQVAREVLLGVQFWYLGGSYGVRWWPWAAGLAVVLASLAGLRQHPRWRWLVLLALIQLIGLALSVFTVSGLFHTHMALLLPLPIMLVGATLAVPPRPWMRVALAGLAGLLMVSSGLVNLRYHTELGRLGGLGAHSDAIYRLVEEIEAEPPGPVVALDWGFAPQVRQLTGDRIQPVEVFGYDWAVDAGFAGRTTPFFTDPDTLYVLHWANEEVFPRREAFFALVTDAGLTVDQRAIVSRRDGAPVFELVRLRE